MNVFAILLLAAAAYGQTCVHTNSMNMIPDLTLLQVIKDTDKNGDGVFDDGELITEFIGPMNTNGDLSVSMDEFTSVWEKKYLDNKAMAEELFRCIDPNDDGKLSLFEVGRIKSNVDSATEKATARDGKIQADEFVQFMLEKCYSRCTRQPTF